MSVAITDEPYKENTVHLQSQLDMSSGLVPKFDSKTRNPTMELACLFTGPFSKRDAKQRTKYMYQVFYLNGWECPDDMDDCKTALNPDFEKLYQHYRQTKLVPLFSRLVVSFVRYVNEYVDSNYDRMLVVSEDLMKNWCQMPGSKTNRKRMIKATRFT